MVVDGKIELLDKMIHACFDDYAKQNKSDSFNPVLLFVNEAKFYEDANIEDVILNPKFLVIALNKVISYKCKAMVGQTVVAEILVGFGVGQ